MNRPSLAETLIKKGPYRAGQINPLGGLITSNQLNALRDYILELERGKAPVQADHDVPGASAGTDRTADGTEDASGGCRCIDGHNTE